MRLIFHTVVSAMVLRMSKEIISNSNQNNQTINRFRLPIAFNRCATLYCFMTPNADSKTKNFTWINWNFKDDDLIVHDISPNCLQVWAETLLFYETD